VSATRISAKGEVRHETAVRATHIPLLALRAWMDGEPERGAVPGTECLNVPDLLGPGLAAGDEVEDRGAEVGQPLLADALAAEQGGW
jgi:hypothetical protein